MKLPRLLLILMLALGPAIAWAQGFDLPGLSQESGAYQQSLQRRFPAGGTPQQRAAAERRAQDSTARRDFAAAAAALEERIGLGNSNADGKFIPAISFTGIDVIPTSFNKSWYCSRKYCF